MFYKYKVTWYNSYEDKELTETGLVHANSYGNAANAVVEDYGKNDVIDIYLYEIYNEGGGACISVDELKDTFDEENK
jgi:hypothetical protein